MDLSIVLSILLGFVVSAVAGRLLIPALRRLKAGQAIKEIGPTWHMTKQGTPTMGGLMLSSPSRQCWWSSAGRT